MEGPVGSQHTAFVNWAEARGILVNGVAPSRFLGRGLGIKSTRKIKSGEILVEVPTALLLTTSSIPQGFRSKHVPDITVHGLLASFLAFANPSTHVVFEKWRATWPSPADLKGTMPLLWPNAIHKNLAKDASSQDLADMSKGLVLNFNYLLPPGVSGLYSDFQTRTPRWFKTRPDSSLDSVLAKQKSKLALDFTKVRHALGDAFVDANGGFDRYAYFWCIVNTRCFYYVPYGEKPPENSDEAMALCPFIDYFNHADHGCDVTFNSDGYTLTANRDYEEGEELYVSYGGHSNDFLLAEYGFILDSNSHDHIRLDDIIFESLSWHHNMESRLDRVGYSGNYTLSPSGEVCFRTEVAARIDVLPRKDWLGYIAGSWTDDDDTRPKHQSARTVAGARIARWVADYWNEAYAALKLLEELDANGEVFEGNGYAKDVLQRRWRQIEEMCARKLIEYLDFDDIVDRGKLPKQDETRLVEMFPALRARVEDLKRKI